MNREQIIRMAREAGFDSHDMSADFTCNLIDIERFASLVAAAEREACAKVCEQYADVDSGPGGIEQDFHAKLIRARGETK